MIKFSICSKTDTKPECPFLLKERGIVVDSCYLSTAFSFCIVKRIYKHNIVLCSSYCLLKEIKLKNSFAKWDNKDKYIPETFYRKSKNHLSKAEKVIL